MWLNKAAILMAIRSSLISMQYTVVGHELKIKIFGFFIIANASIYDMSRISYTFNL